MKQRSVEDHAYDSFLGFGKQARARRAMKLRVKEAKKMAKVEIKLARAQKTRDRGQSMIMKEQARNTLAEQGQSMGAGGAIADIAKGLIGKGDSGQEQNPGQPVKKNKNILMIAGLAVALIIVVFVIIKMRKK